ncbi:MAG: DNA methyltransferase, partial [Sedimentisphaerales bacterium]|nr:DNA methyltransferase [Sedimentisphaerales bacterium]
GVVLDLFMGSGTTAIAAKRCGRHFVGFELNPEYCQIIQDRLASPEAELSVQSNLPTEPVREKIPNVKSGKRGRPGGKISPETETKNAPTATSDPMQKALIF